MRSDDRTLTYPTSKGVRISDKVVDLTQYKKKKKKEDPMPEIDLELEEFELAVKKHQKEQRTKRIKAENNRLIKELKLKKNKH